MNRNQGALWFFVLLMVIGLVAGTGVLILKVSNNEAKIEDARARQALAAAQVAEAQPDIIVARSQANINNSVAMTNLKDGALLVVVVIMLLKDKKYERD